MSATATANTERPTTGPLLPLPRRRGRPSKPPRTWLTIEDVARRFGCHPDAVQAALDARPSFFPQARGSLIPSDDVTIHLENGERLPPPLTTLAEFAELLGMSYTAADKARQRGRIQALWILDAWRVRRSEYWRLVNEGKLGITRRYRLSPQPSQPTDAAPFSFSRISTGEEIHA